MGASMSRPAVLAALVGVALASSLPGEEVLKGRDKLFLQFIAVHKSRSSWARVRIERLDKLSDALTRGKAVNWSGDEDLALQPVSAQAVAAIKKCKPACYELAGNPYAWQGLLLTHKFSGGGELARGTPIDVLYQEDGGRVRWYRATVTKITRAVGGAKYSIKYDDTGDRQSFGDGELIFRRRGELSVCVVCLVLMSELMKFV